MAHQPHQEGNDPAASLKMVFVASADVLAAWSSRSVACTDIISFTDSDSKHALDAIRVGRPDMVILEQRFAATARGVAFINELQTDPAAFGTEIRLLSPERTAMIASPSFAGAAPGALGNLAQPIPPRPMRRAQRVRLPDGAEAAIDGQHA